MTSVTTFHPTESRRDLS